MKSKKQLILRNLVKIRDEFQNMRKRIDNRRGRKADGTLQNVDERNVDTKEKSDLDNVEMADINEKASILSRGMENDIEKELKKELKDIPVYIEWLSKQKGVGPVTAGWILAEFDIEIATTVSKLWQYGGMNPGLVLGKKRIKKKDYKPAMGDIIEKITFKDEISYLIITDEYVRGDRATPGFVLPYNKKIKTVLLGVLADSFIKQNAPYRLNYYDPYKKRLENEDNTIYNPDEKRMRQDDGKSWKSVSKGHRDRAAKRYMIKMFLKDLYVAWREIEGLPVRRPYAEEYLGKKHGNVIALKKG